MTEERFVEIEIKLSRQEDLLDTLNHTIIRQQKQIQQLDALCAALARRMQQPQSDNSERSALHEKPPHY